MSPQFEAQIVVVGGANLDYLIRGPSLPRPGETVRGDRFVEAAGGKGANQAVAAARLGASVALVARVGTDRRGDAVIEHLADEGVRTHLVQRDERPDTGVALLAVDDHGQKEIITALGANERLELPGPALDALRTADALLVQLEIPIWVVREAVRAAHYGGAKVVLDASPLAALPDDIISMSDVVRVNTQEAEVLTGVRVTDRGTAKWAADLLLSRGARALAIQAAGEGDILVWSSGSLFLPKVRVKSVDTTGAGDAFAAALALVLAEGRSLSEAGPFASAAAALATTEIGAQAGLPRRDAVMRLLGRPESVASRLT